MLKEDLSKNNKWICILSPLTSQQVLLVVTLGFPEDAGHQGTWPKRGSTQSLVRPGRQDRVVKKNLGTTSRIQEEIHEGQSRILRRKTDTQERAAMNTAE